MTNSSATSSARSAAPLDDDDPRSLFAGAVAQAADLIAGVRPDQLADPTPCTEMDVRTLLAHLVMVLDRVDAAGRGIPSSEWPMADTECSDDAWGAAWRDAAHRLQATWADDAVLARSMTTPWGATMSGAELLTLYTNEVVVHSWDLARATRQSPVWNERVVAAAWRGITAQLPDADRAPAWEAAKAELPADFPWADPFANAVDIDESAPLIDRLVAWNGRTPG